MITFCPFVTKWWIIMQLNCRNNIELLIVIVKVICTKINWPMLIDHVMSLITSLIILKRTNPLKFSLFIYLQKLQNKTRDLKIPIKSIKNPGNNGAHQTFWRQVHAVWLLGPFNSCPWSCLWLRWFDPDWRILSRHREQVKYMQGMPRTGERHWLKAGNNSSLKRGGGRNGEWVRLGRVKGKASSCPKKGRHGNPSLGNGGRPMKGLMEGCASLLWSNVGRSSVLRFILSCSWSDVSDELQRLKRCLNNII